MKRVDLYARVRYAVMIEGESQREASQRFGIDPRTVKKMLNFSVPPGYVRSKPPARPKLDGFTDIIDRILEEDKHRPKKQRHTSKRITSPPAGSHGGGAAKPPLPRCGPKRETRPIAGQDPAAPASQWAVTK